MSTKRSNGLVNLQTSVYQSITKRLLTAMTLLLVKQSLKTLFITRLANASLVSAYSFS